MYKLTSLLTSSAIAVMMTVSPTLAADAITGSDPVPAPESFDSSRFYGSIFGGVSFLGDADLAGLVGGAPQTVELDFDTGYTVGGAIGHSYGDIGNGLLLRAELELSYSENDIDQIFFSGNGPAAEVNVGGDFSTTNLLVNAVLDIPKWGNEIFTPYAGVGVGVAFTQLDAVYGPGVRLDQSDENFIAQGIIGASFAATDTADFFVEGRYARIFDFDTPRFAPTGALTGVIEDDIDTYGLNAGLRFKF